MPKGPRAIFKDDRDSSIKRGCVLYAASFEPAVIAIVQAALLSAPKMVGDYVLFSEGWRSLQHGKVRDRHSECCAFDISLNNLRDHTGGQARGEIAWRWVDNMKLILGGMMYDFDVHGEGSNNHIHVEYDPVGS